MDSASICNLGQLVHWRCGTFAAVVYGTHATHHGPLVKFSRSASPAAEHLAALGSGGTDVAATRIVDMYIQEEEGGSIIRLVMNQ